MKKIVPLQLLEIDDDGYHILVEGVLNGGLIRLIVDTGASKTVFDENRLSALMDSSEFETHDQLSTAVGSNEITSKITRLENLKIGEFTTRNFEVAVMDLEHVHLSYEKLNLPEVHGVLGSDFLQRFRAVINFENKTLELDLAEIT